MAEAMELDLSLKKSTNSPVENPIVPPPEKLEKEKSKNIPSQFTIQKYYDNLMFLEVLLLPIVRND